ncbi:mucin-4-like [Planococcus citri]|uniref:mucin-4-like n=1 Tax=Planococcus citri TaxID=170843 RepID=UPI0031F79BAB
MPCRRTLWLLAVFCAYSLTAADETTTPEWSNITTLPTPHGFVFNSTDGSSNSTTPPSFEHADNETDASNFIVTDYANSVDSNSTYLEHFTKFNWTVLDGFDYTFGGTDDEGVKHSAGENNNTTGGIAAAAAFFNNTNDDNNSNNNKSRTGYERNLMVVLPVMQGNSDLTNSNLQVLYTKPPVTAIIGGEQSNESKRGEPQAQARTTIRLIENQVMDYASTTTQDPVPVVVNKLERIDHEFDLPPPPSIKRQDFKRHPYTDFLFGKPSGSKPKSPLDYGYPDTLKFIEDFNEVPKNHRPDWNLPEVAPTSMTTKKSASFGVTKRDPFQMFESVKPLEINKLLSFKPIPVTDSIVEETTHQKKKHQHQFLDLSTELPVRQISKRPSKRPGKKPQKNKTTVLTKFQPQFFPEVTTKATIFSPSIEDIYASSKYSNSLQQTTPGFLPTPYREPSVIERTVETTTPRGMTTESLPTSSTVSEITREEISSTYSSTTPSTTVVVTSTTSTTVTEPATISTATTTTTTTTQTPIPTTQSTSASTINTTLPISTTECSTDHKKHQIKPSDLINLKKILDEEFGSWPKRTTEPTTVKTPAPSGDVLTSEMRTMLIALGLLKPDGQIRDQLPVFTTTTTTNNYLEEMLMKRDPVTPTIDPHSYANFKKIPIDFGRPSERLPVSDDMKDLLASFGLLPRRSLHTSLLHRMTRQQKMLGNGKPINFTTVDLSSSPNNLETNSTTIEDAEPTSIDDPKPTSIDDPNPTSIEETNPTTFEETNLTFNDTEPLFESLDSLTALPFNYVPHEKGHVFHPTIHLETLGDESKLRKIHHVIETIKKLSHQDNISVEEIETHLETITSLVSDEAAIKDPFLSELRNIVAKTKSKLKHYKDKTIDLKTNSDLNFNSDESSIVSTYSTRTNLTDLTQAIDAPNPLSTEELQNLLEAHKNEVKRQQPTNNTSGSAPIPDLAASFGGGETASDAPTPEDLPTGKPNGLYFFVDWNTFLNVGEAEKNPVRVRFSPRAGNPRNFIPITLP